MSRLIALLAAAVCVAGSPALAGGSLEKPTDKKAPESNATGTDNPASTGQGAAKPAGEGAPVPKDAAKGSSASDATRKDK